MGLISHTKYLPFLFNAELHVSDCLIGGLGFQFGNYCVAVALRNYSFDALYAVAALNVLLSKLGFGHFQQGLQKQLILENLSLFFFICQLL